MNEEAIFVEALSKGNPAQRQAFLEQACAGDEALRRRVQALLEVHARAGSFLERPPLGPVTTDVLSGAGVSPGAQGESPGALVGPYKLLEPIGAGGMGT